FHGFANGLGGQRTLGAEIDEPIVDVASDVLETAQPAERLFGLGQTGLGELGDPPEPNQIAVLIGRADALNGNILHSRVLAGLTYLLRIDVPVELQLHHRAAGKVDAQVQPEHEQADDDCGIEYRRDKNRRPSLADEIDVGLVLENLHRILSPALDRN